VAELIIERWRLAVLRVQLDLSTRKPEVIAQLVGYPTSRATTFWKRRYPLSAFKLDATPPKSVAVPDELSASVAKTLHDELNGQAALWLRLVPPYGYLGAAPWESELIEATGLPLLRVPDRLPVPASLGETWRVAVIVCAMSRRKWAKSYLRGLTEQLQAVPAPVQVDIFADARIVDALGKETLPPSVSVHNPEKAEFAASLPSQNWADWIRSGLGGDAVRALHLVLDAAFDADRPLLALQSDPRKPVPRSKCTFVAEDAILALADAIGSDTLSLGSPPGNPSDLATRMIADSIGQQRAGPTIYSSVEQDPRGTAVAGAFAFVVDRSGQIGIPRNPSLFAYLQPEYIQASLEQAWPAEAGSPDQTVLPAAVELPGYTTDSRLETHYQGAKSVPSWVAASDRYIGSQWAGLVKQASTPVPKALLKGSYDKGAAEALTLLRDIVDKHARPQ
jgi:hypothetical protein